MNEVSKKEVRDGREERKVLKNRSDIKMKDMKENTTQEKVSSQAQSIMIKVKSKA